MAAARQSLRQLTEPLYRETAAALADVSAIELLDEPDVERMTRLAVVALRTAPALC